MPMMCQCDHCGRSQEATRNGLRWMLPEDWSISYDEGNTVRMYCCASCADIYKNLQRVWQDTFGRRR